MSPPPSPSTSPAFSPTPSPSSPSSSWPEASAPPIPRPRPGAPTAARRAEPVAAEHRRPTGRRVVVGEVATGVDLLVVGGGPGGDSAALRAAAAGRTVTLVERDRIGGVCLNVGCIPSKALIPLADTPPPPPEAAPLRVDPEAPLHLDPAHSR